MSPDDYRGDQSAMWGVLVVVVLVLIAMLLIGYFAWWAPAQRQPVIIEQPAPAPPQEQPGIAPPPQEQPAPRQQEPAPEADRGGWDDQ